MDVDEGDETSVQKPSPELGWIASAGGDGVLKIWEIKVSKGYLSSCFSPWLQDLSPHTSYIYPSTCRINLYSLRTQKPEATTDSSLSFSLLAFQNESHGVADVNAVVWCPRDGFRNLLASAGDDGIVRVWKIAPSL